MYANVCTRKHEKRHTRPWGCTHSNCFKTFGSKNDWKRHEHSQHYQGLETWRCHEFKATSKIHQCARLFYRRDSFQTHIRKEHNIQDDNLVREQCKKARIGRNGQCGFWCGFCKAIVQLETRGVEAWDERFNHIDDKHFKLGQRIETWYPPDEDIPKDQLRNENPANARSFSSAADDSGSEDSDVDEPWSKDSHIRRPLPPPPPPSPPPQPLASSSGSQPPNPPLHPTALQQRTEQDGRINAVANKGLPSGKRMGKTWFCVSSEAGLWYPSDATANVVHKCKCGSGPHNATIMVTCLGDGSCAHHRCTTCRRE